MTTNLQKMFGNIEQRVRGMWYGEDFGFGHVFLGLAVWNAFVSAINVTFWPRLYDLETIAFFMPLRSVLIPVILCLIIASFSRTGLRPVLKTYAAIGVIAFITWLIWSPESQAWLKEVRRLNP